MAFDYFYGRGTEQYAFYQVPKILITDDQFADITTDAKLLYSLMLDRSSLSAKNGWLDKEGKVYIFYTLEHIVNIPVKQIHEFKDHPFKVQDDEDMRKTADSIREYGVLVPVIVRPDGNGEYEMISGHRRRYASILAGKEEIPAIIREMDDDIATILMVDSNLQREHNLPSERAKAYKMKMEALKHQGRRIDLTSCQIGTKFRADEELAKQAGESARTVQRFVRLNNLIPELLNLVDEKKIAFNPAVELS